MTKKKVAIIGGGVAGLTTAYLLRDVCDVHLFEANDYIGGHSNTVLVNSGSNLNMPIDTGFIVFNDQNYPLFNCLLNKLKVESKASDMSFSYYSQKDKLMYSSNFPNGIFSQKWRLFNPSYWRFLFEIHRFNSIAKQCLIQNKLGDISLSDFLHQHKFSDYFKRNYILPMGAAIWSSSINTIESFLANSFIYFFYNHGLLKLSNRPMWKTVVGGSQSYVQVILDELKGKFSKSKPVSKVIRNKSNVKLLFESGDTYVADKVIIATHADQALALLDSPSDEEKNTLGVWEYSSNHVYLHTDSRFMPPKQSAWASWNFFNPMTHHNESPLCVTYYMNHLQKLNTEIDYFVTLNPTAPIPKESVIKSMVYSHPIYSKESLLIQAQLKRLNNQQNTYYCGSYFGFGFHEDAVRSANDVARYFMASL